MRENLFVFPDKYRAASPLNLDPAGQKCGGGESKHIECGMATRLYGYASEVNVGPADGINSSVRHFVSAAVRKAGQGSKASGGFIYAGLLAMNF